MAIPILSEEARNQEAEHEAATRHIAITTKLSEPEAESLNRYADQKGTPRSEIVREAVLALISQAPTPEPPTPELTEIVGVRLLLMNLLKPLVTGKTLTVEDMEKISKNVKAMKKTAAAEILSGERD